MLRSWEDRSSCGSGSIIWLSSRLVLYALVFFFLLCFYFPQDSSVLAEAFSREVNFLSADGGRVLLCCRPHSYAYGSSYSCFLSLSISVICLLLLLFISPWDGPERWRVGWMVGRMRSRTVVIMMVVMVKLLCWSELFLFFFFFYMFRLTGVT